MENYFCMSVRVVNNFIKKYVNERINSIGLTSFQCGVLAYIYEVTKFGKDVFQKDLENFFVTSKSSMSNLLQSLETKGLIIRKSLENGDSRKKEILITEEGKKVSNLTGKFFDEVEEILLSSLNKEEKEELFKILSKFNERMEKRI